ncbi:MAG TPA: benzoate-CoA ligase family protein [Caulobacteraceae bacterium]|nr:benzoate-CoA ligase family protein [Caulobacteraceae bacterium]
MPLARALEDLPVAFNAAADLLAGAGSDASARRVAYLDDRGAWTYGEIAERVDRFAGLLTELGVEREQRVLLCLQDSADFPTAFLGAIKAGVVPVPVNTLLKADDYAYALADSRARAVFVSEALAPTLYEAAGGGPIVIVAGDGEGRLEARLDAATPRREPAETCRDEPAFWLYTSGSTGRPKAAIHAHASPRLTADLYARGVLGLREDDVVLSVAKLYFAYGLGNGLTFPLSVGAKTVLLRERPTPAVVSKLMLEHGVTVLQAAPTFFAAMLADPGTPERLPALRIATSAGEALPASIGEAFTARFGVEILDGLGSTEMLHIFISQRPGAVRYGVTGKPVPGYDLRIVAEDGSDCADGQLGDLHVRGPTAALGYWNNRPKSRETFLGPWTRTGDKYVRDAEGWHRYAGRSDDMLKVSGQYVSPFAVEEALAAHPDVLEAAVIGCADENGLTKPKAFVVCRDAAAASPALAAALQAHVKGRLAPHCYPRWIEFRAELPKTATGKLQRYLLRAEGPAGLP